MAIKKATKKFNKNKLKTVIEQRKKRAARNGKSSQSLKESFQKNKKQKIADNSTGREHDDGDMVIDKSASEDNELIMEQQEQDAQSDGDVSQDEGALNEHALQLEQLKSADPDFYKYLKENDPALLQFNEELEDGNIVDDEANISDLDEDDLVADEQDSEISEDPLDDIIKQIRDNSSVSAAKQAISMLKTMLMPQSESDNDDGDEGEMAQLSAATLNDNSSKLIEVITTDIPLMICKQLGVSGDTNSNRLKSGSSNAAKKYKVLMKQYSTCLVILLDQLQDREMFHFIVVKLEQSKVALLLSMLELNKITKKLWTLLIEFACNCKVDTSVDYNAQRDIEMKTGAMVLIKSWLSAITDKECRLFAGKLLIKSFLTSCKSTATHNYEAVEYVMKSIVETLIPLKDLCYTVGFLGIRQLAVLLRNAITKPSADNSAAIANWSTVWSVRLWCLLLHRQCPPKEDIMHQLYFPLTTVAFGIIRFASAKQYLPLRLHLLKALQSLSGPKFVFLPILSVAFSNVMDVVQVLIKSKDGPAAGSGGGGKPAQIQFALKLSTKYAGTALNYVPMLDYVIDEVVEADLVSWSRHVAFPELSVCVKMQLRQIRKLLEQHYHQLKALDGFKKKIVALQKCVDENSQWVQQQRLTIQASPLELASNQASEICDQGPSPLEKYVKAVSRVRQSLKRIQ
ncbi:hypothetical protein MP228_007513 [Amoeboaphelidium protococcarum]|nr:hypothetical protein MP228_007513 [Amoeboaphelidium protococcarum]